MSEKIIELLEKTGLNVIYKPEEFVKEDIVLRDGRNAFIWVNKNDNHGILDSSFWENESYYEENYREEYSANLNSYTKPNEHLNVYKNVNKRQFNQFKKFLNSETNFLEIGCSFGGILKQINKINIKSKNAIEPNKKDSFFCSKKYKNVNIINSIFQNHDFGKQKFNLIVSFEVLEHVYNIDTFLKKVSSVLDNNGIVNFEVPNHNDALLRNYNVERYKTFYYHKAHIHYFTPDSLKKIFNHYKINGDVYSFQMYPFLNQIYWVYNNQPQPSAELALNYPDLDKNENLVNKEISKFLKKINNEYQKIMNKELSGDCLVFVGKKQ
jgi:2-polyprenyl-3-methyl-5-hydroxy-6-metoxy-1,4-benzoquinol methylase